MVSPKKPKYSAWRQLEKPKPKGLARLRLHRLPFPLFRLAGRKLIKKFASDKSIQEQADYVNDTFVQMSQIEERMRKEYRKWAELPAKERREREIDRWNAKIWDTEIVDKVSNDPYVKNWKRQYRRSASELVTYRLVLESMLAVASPPEFKKWESEKPKKWGQGAFDKIYGLQQPALAAAKNSRFFKDKAWIAWSSCVDRMAAELSGVKEGLGLDLERSLNHFLRQANLEKIMRLRKILKRLGVEEIG